MHHNKSEFIRQSFLQDTLKVVKGDHAEADKNSFKVITGTIESYFFGHALHH